MFHSLYDIYVIAVVKGLKLNSLTITFFTFYMLGLNKTGDVFSDFALSLVTPLVTDSPPSNHSNHSNSP